VRDQPNVMLTSYSRMTGDPAAHIRRFADFIGIPLDDELLELAVERTSRTYMLAHKDRFDDALLRELSETKGGLPRGSDSAKVRPGSGTHKGEIPPAIARQMEEIWAERVTAALGFRNFAELEAAL
jgi:Sulfotransferase domain